MDTGQVYDKYHKKLSEAVVEDIRNIYGHITQAFLREESELEKMKNVQQKQQATAAYQRKLRSFIQSFGITLMHCSDRLVTDSFRYYSQHVLAKTLSVEEQEQAGLQKQLDDVVVSARQQAFVNAYNSVETDSHDAATERAARIQLSEELGLQTPMSAAERDAYSAYAVGSAIPKIREAFTQRFFTPQFLVDYVRNQVEPRKLHQKILEHFTTQYPGTEAADLYEDDALTIKKSTIVTLLSDLGYIQAKPRENRNLWEQIRGWMPF